MKHPLLTAFSSVLLATQALAADFTLSPDWAKLPAGGPQLGNMHGDVAVSSKNETYVSVMDPAHGILVFGADGRLARARTGAPNDFHGFLIHREAAGEFIYGARLTAQTIVKLTLDGKVVLEIPASAIPDRVKMLQPEPAKGAPAPAAGTPAPGTPILRLTGMAVAPNGDLYVTDGYATSNVHRFDRTGKYLATFGGKDAPYGFKTLHKIVIDPRFTPARLARGRLPRRLRHRSLATLGARDPWRPRGRRRTARTRHPARQGRQGRDDPRHQLEHGRSRDQPHRSRQVACRHLQRRTRRGLQRARRSLGVGVDPLRPDAPV